MAKRQKNGVVLDTTSNVKLFLGDHMVEDNVIIYIYKDLRLRILGLMSHETIIRWMAT